MIVEANNISELVRAVSDCRTRGYEVEFRIQPNSEKWQGFLVIDVESTDPEYQINGQWWFYADNTVMQVL